MRCGPKDVTIVYRETATRRRRRKQYNNDIYLNGATDIYS